jgi:hypothetical protein
MSLAAPTVSETASVRPSPSIEMRATIEIGECFHVDTDPSALVRPGCCHGRREVSVSRRLRVWPEPSQHLVDDFPICVERDPDEVKFIRGDGGDCRAIRVVVGSGEEITREDREPVDASGHRSLVGAPETVAVGCVDHDRLSAHRQIAVSGAVDVRLPDE